MRWLKRAGLVLAAVVVLLGLAIVYILAAFPREIPVEQVDVAATRERVARGRYLVDHVAFCLNCHSERDWKRVAGPVVAATMGRGAHNDIFGDGGFPSANITPFALAGWSDGEILRAITSGIGKDGSPLHPEMPYLTYARLAREDAYAILAYLRTLEPIEHVPTQPQTPFWLSLVARVLPRPYAPPPPVDPDDSVALGKYLVRVADCRSCHRSDFSGGRTLRIPGGGAVVSMNLTPVAGTRIGDWTREDFIGVFKSFNDEETRNTIVAKDGMNTVMPWIQYSGMTKEDLGAIYDYLRTVPPVTK